MLPPQLQRNVAGTQEQLEQYRLQLRADRGKALKKAGWIACAFAACLLAAIAVGNATDYATPSIIAIVVAAIGILATLIYALSRSNTLSTAYADAYKTEINNAIVKHFSPALSYNETGGIGWDVFVASQLFLKPDRYETSDLVSGAYGKTQLKFARVHAEEKHTRKTKSGTETYYTTIFQGVLLVADFNKNFRGHTYVRTDVAERTFGHFGRTLQKLSTALSSDQLVQLENPDFEKEFAVYTSDQVEARYILSPALMERMLELKRRSGVDMQFSFHDSSVTISIDKSDALPEPDFSRPANDAAQLEKIYMSFAFYIGVVDDLDLNTRLWSKE